MTAMLTVAESGCAGSPRRVLLVVDSLDAGGAERHVVDLACALTAAGREVAVACSTPGPLAADAAALGVPVVALLAERVKRRFSPGFAAALRGLLAREPFDLVHAHVHASATAAAAALRGAELPLVVTEHTEAPWRGPADRVVARRALRRADHVIAVSRAIRRHAIRDLGVAPARATYVPNAIAPGAPALEAGDAALPGGDGPVIGVVCRLAPEKGVDVFLRAAAMVARRLPAVRVAVIGDGPVRPSLERLAGELGLGARVGFLGHRPDARALIARLDLLAVPSLSEGAPLVNLEAMAAGTPIVASASGGIPDQIRDGVDGLLVPPRRADALADAIARLLGDRALAARLGASARRRARTEFSYAVMLRRIEAIYRLAAGARADAPAGAVTARRRLAAP